MDCPIKKAGRKASAKSRIFIAESIVIRRLENIALLLFIALSLCNNVARGQDTLSLRNQKQLSVLHEQLKLDTAQHMALHEIFLTCQLNVDELDKERSRIQRLDSSEVYISKQVQIIAGKRRESLSLREQEILAVLNTEQKETYKTKIKPDKPQVLHFGIHNRKDCDICKIPE